jgi:hypothetical protein
VIVYVTTEHHHLGSLLGAEGNQIVRQAKLDGGTYRTTDELQTPEASEDDWNENRLLGV